MISKKHLTYIGFLGFALSACATGYEEFPSTLPHSTLTFEKSVSGKLLFRGAEPSIVTYQIYKDSACTEPVPAVNFSPTSAKEKSMRFEADATLRMVVNMVYKTGSIGAANGIAVPTGTIVQKNCIGLVKFNPKANQSYRLNANPTENPEICTLNVINSSTGVAPSDLVQSESEVCK